MIRHERQPRLGFLSIMPKHGTIVEVGVFKGKNASNILRICKPKKLFLIDCWVPQKEDKLSKEKCQELYKEVKAKFQNVPEVSIMRKFSHQAVKHFENESVDWVFIDANHSHKAVLMDIKLWWPKVKSGGYLSGHDYCVKDHIEVELAVNEFARANKLMLDIIGEEPDELIEATSPNWRILKP